MCGVLWRVGCSCLRRSPTRQHTSIEDVLASRLVWVSAVLCRAVRGQPAGWWPAATIRISRDRQVSLHMLADHCAKKSVSGAHCSWPAFVATTGATCGPGGWVCVRAQVLMTAGVSRCRANGALQDSGMPSTAGEWEVLVQGGCQPVL